MLKTLSVTRLRAFVIERRARLTAVLVLLAVVWGVPPLLSPDLGLAFGATYQLFYSAFILVAALFFELLRAPPPANPAPARGSWRVISRIVLVYGVTVGGLVGVGSLYPQFDVPRLKPGQTSLSPEERGKAIFWDRTVGCFACHAIGGIGGRRAPDLSGVGTRAGTRIPDTPADEYIYGHITQGSKFFNVPGYPPIMPPFGQRLPSSQIEDLIAYLLSLK